MSFKKKLYWIIIAVLFAMAFACGFGLSLISDVFVLVGLYCGMVAFMGLPILLAWMNGERPPFLVLGLLTMAISWCLLSTDGEFPYVRTSLSALFLLAGLVTVVKGITDWYNAKNSRLSKRTKLILLGIGLFVGGCVVSVVLFRIHPLLTVLGYTPVVAGLVLFGKGIAAPKKETRRTPAPKNPAPSVLKTPERCSRCGRELNKWEMQFTPKAGGGRICADCEGAVPGPPERCACCGRELNEWELQFAPVAGIGRFCADCESTVQKAPPP